VRVIADVTNLTAAFLDDLWGDDDGPELVGA